MKLFQECKLYDPDHAGDSIFPSDGTTQHQLTPNGQDVLSKLLRDSAEYLDAYPREEFRTRLTTMIADAKQQFANPNSALADWLKDHLQQFFFRLDAQEEWETLFPVSGIAPDQEPFLIAQASFFKLDIATYETWKPKVPRPFAHLDVNLLGEWVAAIKVRALDHAHARAKAIPILEQAINTIRYGAFPMTSAWKCVRFGAGSKGYWGSQAFARPASHQKAISQLSQDGSDGFSVKFCDLVCGYYDVVKILEQPQAERTPLQQDVLRAVTWVGQAAAAPLESVRLALLITAFEVLLINEHESKGKKPKISSRLAATVALLGRSSSQAANDGTRLYALRSEVLHSGSTEVTCADVLLAFDYVTMIVTTFLTSPALSSCKTLTDVLAILKPEGCDRQDEGAYI